MTHAARMIPTKLFLAVLFVALAVFCAMLTTPSHARGYRSHSSHSHSYHSRSRR